MHGKLYWNKLEMSYQPHFGNNDIMEVHLNIPYVLLTPDMDISTLTQLLDKAIRQRLIQAQNQFLIWQTGLAGKLELDWCPYYAVDTTWLILRLIHKPTAIRIVHYRLRTTSFMARNFWDPWYAKIQATRTPTL